MLNANDIMKLTMHSQKIKGKKPSMGRYAKVQKLKGIYLYLIYI